MKIQDARLYNYTPISVGCRPMGSLGRPVIVGAPNKSMSIMYSYEINQTKPVMAASLKYATPPPPPKKKDQNRRFLKI